MRRLSPVARLAARFARIRAGRDRGAAAAIVSIVAGFGVLTGVAAYVIDVGRIHNEREQLVSGADSVSWAYAECLNRATCDAATRATLSARAGQNARDGQSTVAVCGNTGGLAACTAGSGNQFVGCTGTAPALPYAEARTTSRTDGQNGLDRTFSRVSGTTSNITGLGACSRVAWGGTLSRATTIGWGISWCDWNTRAGYLAVSAGLLGGLSVNAGLSLPAPATNQIIQGFNPLTLCTVVPHLTRARGYAFLPHTSGCQTTTTVGQQVTLGGVLTNGVAQYESSCGALLAANLNKPVLVPIFERVSGSTLQILGYAAFVVTGAQGLLGLGLVPGIGVTLCVLSFCFSGYFTRATIRVHAGDSTTTADPATNFGLTTMYRAG